MVCGADNKALPKGEDGYYRLRITGDTTITISVVPEAYKLTFDKGGYDVSFEVNEETVAETTVRFNENLACNLVAPPDMGDIPLGAVIARGGSASAIFSEITATGATYITTAVDADTEIILLAPNEYIYVSLDVGQEVEGAVKLGNLVLTSGMDKNGFVP